MTSGENKDLNWVYPLVRRHLAFDVANPQEINQPVLTVSPDPPLQGFRR